VGPSRSALLLSYELRTRAVGGELPSTRYTLSVASAMRGAVITRAFSLRPDDQTSIANLSGHGSSDHRHAHYLPIANLDTGQIDRIDVWLPEGCTSVEYAALMGTFELFNSEHLRDGLCVSPVAAEARRASRVWRTATPFVLDRHPKLRGRGIKRLVDDPHTQVRLALERRGFPAPQIALWAQDATVPEGPVPTPLRDFVTRRTEQSVAVPGYGATLTFSQDVRGPIALGRLAHFGLGRFVPRDELESGS
jgi:CRISPR-associated protein Csb2